MLQSHWKLPPNIGSNPGKAFISEETSRNNEGIVTKGFEIGSHGYPQDQDDCKQDVGTEL